jgi:hypothetical protein
MAMLPISVVALKFTMLVYATTAKDDRLLMFNAPYSRTYGAAEGAEVGDLVGA